METKKSNKADLENKKGMFFQIGLVVVLGLSLIAFEWKSSTENTSGLGELANIVVEEEIIPITRQEEIKAPPPAQQVIEELNIVEDDEEIEEEIEIQNTESDQTTQVEVAVVQVEEEEVDEVFNFYVLEDKPEFPGGEAALLKWIAQNTKYPEMAKENGIQGRIFVGFVIDKTGKVTEVKILRGVDPYLDKEALRVVNNMPSWSPGKQRGKPVKVSYQVPIKFTLN
ncbi:MAG: energy transducer TonB [Bacteroidetes bacterium GWA2_30_7]|nr:MAG: energy transducer TonB [Bacteroidetes bacterium GWA2_30_7]